MKLSSLLPFSLCTFGCLLTTSKIAQAQIAPDNTVNTQVDRNGNVSTITGGNTQGGNLFHSFQDFSVPTGETAFFNNTDSISKIFSRVTGGNISNIDGIIRNNGNADLFLINPAGIIFGQNARLDIGGSFLGSTSNSILFPDGIEFSATDTQVNPILTINAPIGLGFRDEPGEIINNSLGRGLEVNAGNNISLLGGDVTFNGGRLTAPEGIINLGGLSAAGEIGIDADGNFSFSDGVGRSNISLSNNAIVDVSGDGGGLITINANNLELTKESLFLANIGEGLGSADVLAGTININSVAFSAENNSLIRADNLGTGRAGNINLITDTLNLNSGSAITATTFGVGDAGNISVTARDITLDFEFTGIYSNVGLTNVASESEELDVSGVVGNAGIIDINTDTLTLTNGARIITTSIAQGNGGTVNINATGEVSYIGQGVTPVPAFGGGTDNVVISGSFSQVQQAGNGNAGEVNITADSLTLIDKGAVLVDNSGVGGDAGDITLNIAGDIFLDQTGLILAQVQEGAVGNGGDINITANSLEAQGGSLILADTKGAGNAGNINIDVIEAISLDNGQIISLVDSNETSQTTGNGGNISLTAGELNLINNAQLLADTTAQGDAGNITVDITGNINLDNGSQIQSQTRSGAVGNAGNINITTGGSLLSTNGNLILADSQAQGNGGSIVINAAERVLLEGREENGFPSQVVAGLTREDSEGMGGTIEINAGELVMGDVAFISSNTVEGSVGEAGNITLNVDRLNLSENAFINAFTANDFDGGSIIVNAQTLDFISGGKIFAATAGRGNAGNINLNISDRATLDNSVQASSPLVEFPESEQLSNDLQNSSSGIYANATESASGNGGNINIGQILESKPQNFIISNDAQIDVGSQGTGSGGNIFLASQALELDNNANISASTGFGQGGIITLDIADNLTLNNSSSISAEAFNDANGGNLNIDSRFIIAFPNGDNDILASAENGLGGNININTESLLGIQSRSQNPGTNDINASSQFSLDGTVNVNILNFNPIQGVTELPNNVVESGETVAQSCSTNRAITTQNSFTIKGKGGIIPLPGLPLNSAGVIVDGEVDETVFAIPQPITTSQGEIQPARGIQVTEKGEVILTAYQTNNSGDRISEIKRNCGV
nr:filamentous hemagglutinin N-terminal domain-containing protein [Waterburya agarophytonicola]